ncbi:uncharacterized protein A1O9_08844 [Exophiala aquamarina CBS 119918]|uniref:N-acetylgalactosaminide beta-1,3-galactosyltransferase n=1 Tax=Exophiala aquamarina CBS 119918 TaxID=1182545 RepID=A0A072PI42_9EURO|nr:uncharacterized protein A1O9_08844 [Exophiala aquamarina CBS 119918]KEF55190.1 hypothetical protein A1O9_08844 [Exophiala aquamarina CBS 119918]
MAFALPRGLGPVRLTIIFLILLSLLVFRSYYLPAPGHPETVSADSKSWLSGFRYGYAEDVSDVDPDRYSSVNDDNQTLSDSADTSDTSDLSDPSDPSDNSEAKGNEETYKQTESLPSEPEIPTSYVDGLAVPPCRLLPGADKVVVIVKTGATEAFARLPQQLLTLAECVPNFMVFSDMAQDMGDFHIYDALDEVGKEYKENHEDFKFYNQVHTAHAAHGDVSVLGSEKGWNLDKWKNIPMLHKAYTVYPNADWYMTIDADTYLGWTNLLLLLNKMDPEEPLYAGCVYWHGPTAFAQGGTGYLLSKASVKKFEEIRTPEKIADWEKETSTICCGDVMLGVAMGHAGVSVSGAWPMFQVDPPSGLTWSDAYWCKPAITWHHSPTFEVEALWDFEKEWLNKTWDDEDPGSVPYLYRDAFEYFVEPIITEEKVDWDNLSGDMTYTKPAADHVKEDNDWDWKNDEEKQKMWDDLSELQKKSAESANDCIEACKDNTECVQWSWHPGTCKLQKSIKLGRTADPKKETTSGWMLERVKVFKESRGDCEDATWSVDGH